MADKKTYATNVVTAKLYGLVGSPTEMVLGTAMFECFSTLYEHWVCRVYSARELAAFDHGAQAKHGGCVIGIVPQLPIEGVGRVDFALFAPQLSNAAPLVIVECDGHEFHERTPEQASKDRKRDRALVGGGVPTLRFTGADILRDSAGAASEVAAIYDQQINRAIERWNIEVGDELNKNSSGGFYVPFQWPPSRRDRK